MIRTTYNIGTHCIPHTLCKNGLCAAVSSGQNYWHTLHKERYTNFFCVFVNVIYCQLFLFSLVLEFEKEQKEFPGTSNYYCLTVSIQEVLSIGNAIQNIPVGADNYKKNTITTSLSIITWNSECFVLITSDSGFRLRNC